MNFQNLSAFFFHFIFAAFLASFFGCSPAKKMNRTIRNMIAKESLFDDHFNGFVLSDLESDQTLFSKNGDRLFTPASNTKLLTLLASLTILPDSLPSFYYGVKNDTIYVHGMGDPSTLNPKLGNSKSSLEFLNSLQHPTVFCNNHFFSERYGPGWAWDDYAYGFQLEKTFFPLFGNVLHVAYRRSSKSLNIYPNIVNTRIKEEGSFSVERSELKNDFTISLPNAGRDQDQIHPLMFKDSTIENALRSILNVPVKVSNSCPILDQKRFYFSIPADSAYSLMMKESDNFIAEQLLLMCAGMLSDSLSTDIAINHMTRHFLEEQKLNWRDGSGLSRYNLISPNSLIFVLKEIYKKLGSDGIQKVFPAGGESGTIKNWYANSPNPPFIYAKTGTLTGVHCLSGYLYSDSGKILVFSLMHNNYVGGSKSIKEEMNQILQLIKSKY